jgi:hypothetical protein
MIIKIHTNDDTKVVYVGNGCNPSTLTSRIIIAFLGPNGRVPIQIVAQMHLPVAVIMATTKEVGVVRNASFG